MKIQVFRSKTDSRLWYWRIVARNGKIIANGEGYQRRQKVLKTLMALFRAAPYLEDQMDQLFDDSVRPAK